MAHHYVLDKKRSTQDYEQVRQARIGEIGRDGYSAFYHRISLDWITTLWAPFGADTDAWLREGKALHLARYNGPCGGEHCDLH